MLRQTMKNALVALLFTVTGSAALLVSGVICAVARGDDTMAFPKPLHADDDDSKTKKLDDDDDANDGDMKKDDDDMEDDKDKNGGDEDKKEDEDEDEDKDKGEDADEDKDSDGNADKGDSDKGGGSSGGGGGDKGGGSSGGGDKGGGDKGGGDKGGDEDKGDDGKNGDGKNGGGKDAATQPDLAVIKGHVRKNGQKSYVVGKIKNLGHVDYQSGRTYVFAQKTVQGWRILGQGVLKPIKAGQTVMVRVPLYGQMPARASFRLRLSKGDTNRANDSLTFSGQSASGKKPDLAVKSVAARKAGRNWSVVGRIVNLGKTKNGSDRSFTLSQRTPQGWKTIKSGRVPALMPGKSFSVTVSVPMRGSTTTQFRLRMSPGDRNRGNDQKVSRTYRGDSKVAKKGEGKKGSKGSKGSKGGKGGKGVKTKTGTKTHAEKPVRP